MKHDSTLSNLISRKIKASRLLWGVAHFLALVWLVSNAEALTQPTRIFYHHVDNVNDQVRVIWKDESTVSSGYRVQRRIDNGVWSDLTDLVADSKEYINTGFNASNTYRYRVAPLEDCVIHLYGG